MNDNIIKEISKELNIREDQIKVVLKLLKDDNTVPFIARYRKEMTGSLNEEQIRIISEKYEYQVNLLKKKKDIIRLISEKGLLTPELELEILRANKLIEVEDLYRPFKEKKKTKATEAIKNGLEDLAKKILNHEKDIKILATAFLNENVKTPEEALEGAGYIIAENISDNAKYREYIRNNTYNKAFIKSKIKKNAQDDQKIYTMYYEYQELLKEIKAHRILAINRGEKEEVLSVSIDFNLELFQVYIEKELKLTNDEGSEIIRNSITDALKRLILPSIEREIRSELTAKAEEVAILNFGKNLEKILLQPPLKEKIILGLDPAYRTGCKLAIIDQTGKVLNISVIYPHEPHNKYEEAKIKVKELIDEFDVSIIAIGNGTASRESESFIAEIIKEMQKDIFYILVSEAGASVYSASKLAIKEFPNLQVEERSAISIARRLQDPLSELVKIDPKSIGVGLYQHDVTAKRLDEMLEFVVRKVVNKVGVNLNTASEALLSFVSGLNKNFITKIISYRDKVGKIMNREELKKQKILSDKAFEQAVGFLRIIDGSNVLDKTSIHPESYELTKQLLRKINSDIKQIGTREFQQLLGDLKGQTITEQDIIASLLSPNRDPRDSFTKPILRRDILKVEDLRKGMKLQGTVRNVIDFGAFIDIGLKNDGLVHISQISKNYLQHPSDVLSIGDIVDCYVLDILEEKNKVALTLLESK